MNDLPDYRETLQLARERLADGHADRVHLERLREIEALLTYIGEEIITLPGLLELERRRRRRELATTAAA